MDCYKLKIKTSFIVGVVFLFLSNYVLSQNLVKNPGFESGVFAPYWNIWPKNDSDYAVTDNNNVYVGNFSANLSTEEVYLYQHVNLEPNTTYILSAAIKTESGEIVYLGANNFDGEPVTVTFNHTDYFTDTLYFTTGEIPEDNSSIYIYKTESTGSVWVDNISLTKNLNGQLPYEDGGQGAYYISPSGNDTNSGTSPADAWQTIDKINGVNFMPGDQVLFEGGETFTGTIRLNSNDSGTAGNIVKIGSYGSGKATIDAGAGSGLVVSDCENLVIENLVFKGDGRKTGNSGNGIILSYCSYVAVDHVEIFGFQHSGITAKYVGNNLNFTNIYSHDNGYAGIYVSGNYKTSLSDVYIGYCVTDNNPGDPTVLDNHSGSGIFVYMANKITIEYCKASNNGWDMPRTGNGPGGIWVAEVDSAIIQHCISHDNKTSEGGLDGLGFDLDGGTTNSVIQYCLSYNNQGAGFGIYQFGGASEWKNNTIRYCISENDGNVSANGSVSFWNDYDNDENFREFYFYNNVIYNPNGPALAFLDHKNSDFNFYNNIFVSKQSSVYNGINGENFQGNCWYSLNGQFYLNSAIDFDQWAQATGQEMLNGEIVGMYANPMLVNPGNTSLSDPAEMKEVDDYKPDTGSPVTDAGLDLQTLFNIDPGEQDFFGNFLKPGMRFDMGVYEHLERQVIGFKPGWNIISLRVMPKDSNLLNVFQPLIDTGKLKKVMDEEGKAIEDWGMLGGWNNNIGNLDRTKGYKVSVSSQDSLITEGFAAGFPFKIPLSQGWNIISWPSENEQDGLEVFQSLIDEGKLKKVMDENGNSIEDWGMLGGWTNNIGNLKSGKGYKVNVTQTCNLIINE